MHIAYCKSYNRSQHFSDRLLILMPFCAPIFRENYYTSKKNIEDGLFIIKSLPQQIAQDFGIPVVMANNGALKYLNILTL